MQPEIIETVLNELLQEERASNKKLNELKAIVDKFEKQLSSIHITAPPLNSLPIEILLKEQLVNIKNELNAVHQIQHRERKSQHSKILIVQWLGWILLIIWIAVKLI